MRATDQAGHTYSPNGIQTTTLKDNGVVPTGQCGDGRVRFFNSHMYAIDTVVPIIDLGQRSTWYPAETPAEHSSKSGWTYAPFWAGSSRASSSCPSLALPDPAPKIRPPSTRPRSTTGRADASRSPSRLHVRCRSSVVDAASRGLAHNDATPIEHVFRLLGPIRRSRVDLAQAAAANVHPR
jgi:hypothetical protein